MAEVNISKKNAGDTLNADEVEELVRAIRSAVDREELNRVLSDYQAATITKESLSPILGDTGFNFEQLYINSKQ